MSPVIPATVFRDAAERTVCRPTSHRMEVVVIAPILHAAYPLSPLQQGLLFQGLYAGPAGASSEQLIGALRHDLDVAAFQRAWQCMVERHPALRIAFHFPEPGEPVQKVQEQVILPVQQQDWSETSPEEREARLDAFLETDRQHGFDLFHG